MVKEEIERQIREYTAEADRLRAEIERLKSQVAECAAVRRCLDGRVQDFNRMKSFRQQKLNQLANVPNASKLSRSITSRMEEALNGAGYQKAVASLSRASQVLAGGSASSEDDVQAKTARLAWVNQRIAELRAQLAAACASDGGLA